MIARLTGLVVDKTPNQIILDVHEVGYLVTIGQRDLANLELEGNITLRIYTHVKEDAIQLFGFLTSDDQWIFEQLISVSGVGPKLAMTVLSKHKSDQVRTAIVQADSGFFQAISGIGKKNAQKIIVELKSKFGSLKDLDLSDDSNPQQLDLITALQSLGYTASEIRPLIKNIPGEIVNIEDQIRFVLKQLR